MKCLQKKKIILIMCISILLSILVFLSEHVFVDSALMVERNPYGEEKKRETYELTVEGESEKEVLEIEVAEQEYTKEETKVMFREVMGKLDGIVLGDNQSFNRVEKDLHLVTELEGYPVKIQWELDSYKVMNLYGEIQEDKVVPEGTLVEIRGTISYKESECVYVRHARILPLTRQGTDKLLYDIQQEVTKKEESTREDESFSLPQEIAGKTLKWRLQKESRWYYIALLGIALCIYLVYKEHEQKRRKIIRWQEELLRDFAGMLSKFTMLLGTGATVRSCWERIVQNYEAQKEHLGIRAVYEEMSLTYREIQGGVSEAEAYERFGKRCGITPYIKFGTLLSQNLRKGSKGISEILRMEAIQSFENRKNRARRMGEEAGTKLMVPMLGMLAVVFIIVMVPAFLTIQL